MISRSISSYSVFVFEPLHNPHLKILKLVNQCTIEYLSSNKVKTNRDKLDMLKGPYCSMRNTLMQACNSIFAAMEEESYPSGLHVVFLKR